MTVNKGKLYLIPSPLGNNEPSEVIPGPVLELLNKITTYIVEETRTARRYLSKAGLKGKISSLEFHELNEHTEQEEIESYLSLFEGNNDIGLITEAGLPAVADPGARLVALCHKAGITVVPMVGPSSLMLALMASGMNGQSFAFCGYLPAKSDERRQALKKIEKRSSAENQTQLFIETPYRNDTMMSDILNICRKDTEICVAANITMPDAFIKTLTVSQWKNEKLMIGKRPCVFLLLSK
jgi:16S rRNA (cytidine1402-2'-O)-methyltransferase